MIKWLFIVSDAATCIHLVDCETQTDAMDISETDATPSPSQDERLFGDRGKMEIF